MKCGADVSVVVRRALVVGMVMWAPACGLSGDDVTSTRSSAVTATITISGSVTSAAGLPQAGVTVHLDGTSQAVQVTGSAGTYSFSGLKAGSYSVRPTLNNCSFVPDVVNLNNLTANAVQNFGGSGAACGGTPTVNTGATSGPFTISGHVRDSSGRAIVGARISLGGSGQALRFSDITGSYTFHLGAGSYSLTVAGDCTFNPSVVNVNNLAGNRVQDFQATSNSCVASTISKPNPGGAVFTVTRAGAPLGVTLASLEPRSNNANAVARLQEIGDELTTASLRSVTIAGLPAVERQAVIQMEAEHGPEQPPLLWLTTAIATGTTVVRFETQVPTTASASTINMFFAAGRNFTPDAMGGLHGPPRPTIPAAPRVAPATAPLPAVNFAQPLSNTFGELAIAASETNTIVYATNSGNVFRSPDGGNTFSSANLNFTTFGSTFGDPTLVVGAPAGSAGAQNFYFGTLQQTGGTAANPNMQITVFQSTDQAKNFSERTTPLDCNVAGSGCTVPDQEHLAADHFTQSSQGDRLYVAFRNFNGPTGPNAVGIGCSSDGGSTWTTADTTTISKGGPDRPRMAVAPDGSLFVLYQTGGGSGSVTVWVEKFSSCDSGFTQQTNFPVKLQGGVKEIPLMPGVDRFMSQGPYMVAPDDTDSTGQRLFAFYIEQVSVDSAGAVGNSNVRVAESTNGGAKWTVSPFPVNGSSTGNRYMPWACATQGIAYVTWYDRRDSTTGNADPTAYFRNSVSDPMNTGMPTIGSEVNVSGGSSFDDPACTSGFFPNLGGGLGAARESADELLCTDLPAATVNAGICTSSCAPMVAGPCGSLAPCDFRSGCSTSGESCTSESGIPKYGDYNYVACAGGQLFMTWTSAVVPKGINCSLAGASCTTSANCCTGAGTCNSSVCSPSFGCSANGAACASSGACCSTNCFGGTCQPGVAVFTSSTAVTVNTSCTNSVPDFSFNVPFDVDTGLPPATIGAGYGTAACPGQLVVDVDLTQAGFSGHDLFVSGRWSASLPAVPCDETATMFVFASTDGTSFQTYDIVQYAGVLDSGGTICHAQAQSHTDPGSVSLGGTNVPAAKNFQRVRIALSAVEGSTLVPVLVSGEAL